MNCLLILLYLFFSAPLSETPVRTGNDDYLSFWTGDKGRRFDIVQGYMKDVIVDIMYDETAPIPGGIFAISFSFDCVDFQGKELGCGLYCDNQWGGNRDEQYYFIPLKYEIIGKNHFRLSPDGTRRTVTNKGAPVEWIRESEGMTRLLKELCNKDGWYMSYIAESYMGTSRWILKRADFPEEKQLYYNNVESK